MVHSSGSPSTLPVFTVTVMDVNDTSTDPAPRATIDLLLDELRHQLDEPTLDYLTPPRPLTGGFWAEMFVLELNEARGELPSTLVGRVTPDADHAAWETAVQAAVAEQSFPTPQIHLWGDDAGPLGRAWSLMGLASGRPLLDGLSGVGALVQLPRLTRRLPDQLARISADLHRLDPLPVRSKLQSVTTRSPGIATILDGLEARAAASEDSLVVQSVALLRCTVPTGGRDVVCHGDLHPFNVLADGENLTLLDWTAAQIADRTYDLAFTTLLVSTPPLHAPGPLQPAIGAAARHLGRRFLARYEHHAGVAVDRTLLDWHTTLHATRILCDVTEWTTDGAGGEHQGHPWFSMAPEMKRILEAEVRP